MLVADIVLHAKERYAEKEAVICGKYRLTYAMLIERALRLAAGLTTRGSMPGERIAIMAHNCHRVIEVYIAAALSGLVIAPIKAQYAVDEIQEMLRNTTPAVIIASRYDADKVYEAASVLPQVDILLWDDEEHEKQYTYATGGGEYEWLISHNEPCEMFSSLTENTLFALLYTTGSTGKQKAVMVTQRTQVEAVLSEFANFCFPIGTYIQSGSLLFSSGAGMIVQSLLTGGKQVLLTDSQQHPEQILQAIEEEHADGARFMPSLLHVQRRETYNLSSLRYMIQGGYHLNRQHWQMCIDRFGPILIHGYGMTEAGGIASLMPDEYWRDDKLDDAHLYSCGHALPGVSLRVVDANGDTMPSGESGQVLVHTQALMPGYWRDHAATAQAIQEGWLHTHDTGFLDEAGYLFLQARNENPSGVAIFRDTALETVMCRHDRVVDCVAFKYAAPHGQQTVMLIVELHVNATIQADALAAFCARYVPEDDLPTAIHIIDCFPRNTAGKVLCRELYARYLQDVV